MPQAGRDLAGAARCRSGVPGRVAPAPRLPRQRRLLPAVAGGAAGRGTRVAAVYTQPPRPAGRGHRLQPSVGPRLGRSAGDRGAHAGQPARRSASSGALPSSPSTSAVVAAYGLILPKPILAAPRLGCLNVHGSLLPRWRGAAPIERAILAGDTRDRRHHHADGSRARHRADAAGRARCRSGLTTTAATLHRAPGRPGRAPCCCRHSKASPPERWPPCRSRPKAPPTPRSWSATKAGSTGGGRQPNWSGPCAP